MSLVVCVIVIQTDLYTDVHTHILYIYIHIYMKQIYQKQIFFELPLWAVWLFNRYSFLVVPECLFSMAILKDRVFYLILFKEKDDLTFYA